MNKLIYPLHAFPVLGDLALLLTRVCLGVILVSHGWQKFTYWTLEGTAQTFEQIGAPVPEVSSVLVATSELVGGGLLILGGLTTIVAFVNFLIMIGAALIAHIENGIFVSEGGVELVLSLAAGLLLLAAFGAGRMSVDAAVLTASRGHLSLLSGRKE